MIRVILLFFCLNLLAVPAAAWQVDLRPTPHGPGEFFAVDKNEQELFLFSNKSPLKKMTEMRCSTGRIRGNKKKEGDLKTPEGVYFLERRLNRSLNFELYGDLAYTLNFPNPVDKLQGKTGHGIWIHGRGHEIASYATQGCIALNQRDIESIREEVRLGQTPVLIARDLEWQGQNAQNGTRDSGNIAKRTRKWAKAWTRKANSFFNYYSPDRFSRSGGDDFTSFRNRKERLFRRYRWIDVWVHDLRVLRGPGYWVSYFGQVFNAPGFYSAGVKRLYWMPDNKGRLRIVGSEWQGASGHSLKRKYAKNRKELLRSFVLDWSKAWESGNLERYSRFYAPDVIQGEREGLEAVREYKSKLWDSGKSPRAISVEDLNISLVRRGFRARFVQEYSDVSGYSDRGMKSLTVVPLRTGWKIVREEWREIN